MEKPSTSVSALSYLAKGLPRCSHAYQPNKRQDLDYCDITSKVCLIESDNKCEIFQEELAQYDEAYFTITPPFYPPNVLKAILIDKEPIVTDSWWSAIKKRFADNKELKDGDN